MKLIKRLFNVALLVFATVLVVAGIGVALLWVSFSPSHDEVARVPSPSGDLMATVVEVNGGATTSFIYEIHLEHADGPPRRRRVAWLHGAVRNERAYGVNLRWESPQELHVEYLSARDVKQFEPRSNRRPLVTVVLKPGVGDSSAPPGGMLYNYRRGSTTGG